jgi:hypothetical protein
MTAIMTVMMTEKSARERLAIRVMRSGDCAVKLPEGEAAQVSVPKLCGQLAMARQCAH